MKAREMETRRQVGKTDKDQLERRAQRLGQLVLSASIRVAKSRASEGKGDSASESERAVAHPPDPVVGSRPYGSQLDLNLEGGFGEASAAPQGVERGKEQESQVSARSRRGSKGEIEEGEQLALFQVQKKQGLAEAERAAELPQGTQTRSKSTGEAQSLSKATLQNVDSKLDSELFDPLISTWLDTLATIAADIARRESSQRKE